MRFVQQDDLHGLLDQILDAAIGVMGAEKGSIQLLDEDGCTLRLTAQRGLPRDFLDFFDRVREGEAACGTVLKTRERVTVEDVAAGPSLVGAHALQIMLSAECRAVQSTPLLTRYGHSLSIFGQRPSTLGSVGTSGGRFHRTLSKRRETGPKSPAATGHSEVGNGCDHQHGCTTANYTVQYSRRKRLSLPRQRRTGNFA